MTSETQVESEAKTTTDSFELENPPGDSEVELPEQDRLWRARTGLNEETLCAAIETIIFMSERPIGVKKIRQTIDDDLPLRLIYQCIEQLQKEYEQRHHGLRLQEVAEGYQFRTKPLYSGFVQSLFKVKSLQLSPAALEVLAMIAYQQPVSKTDIDQVRGVDSSHFVRGLMDKRLVKVIGRSEEMGRPSLYGTTQEFLEVFNLSGLNELPALHELEELAKASSVATADMSKVVESEEKGRFFYDELTEIDELAKTIKGIHADTDFTKSLRSSSKKEEGERVSAFDLLEDHVLKKEIIEQNKKAQAFATHGEELLKAFFDDSFESPLPPQEQKEPETVEHGPEQQAPDLSEVTADIQSDLDQENTDEEDTAEDPFAWFDGEEPHQDPESDEDQLGAEIDGAFEQLQKGSEESGPN